MTHPAVLCRSIVVPLSFSDILPLHIAFSNFLSLYTNPEDTKLVKIEYCTTSVDYMRQQRCVLIWSDSSIAFIVELNGTESFS